MSTGPRYSVKFRRHREGKTDYKKRLKLLTSETPRLVVRKSNKYIITQIILFDLKGDKTVVSANSKELIKMNWKHSLKNTSAAYLIGYFISIKAKKKNINEAILDIGLNPAIKGSKLFAVLKGATAASLKVNHNMKILPDDKRLKYMEEVNSIKTKIDNGN